MLKEVYDLWDEVYRLNNEQIQKGKIIMDLVLKCIYDTDLQFRDIFIVEEELLTNGFWYGTEDYSRYLTRDLYEYLDVALYLVKFDRIRNIIEEQNSKIGNIYKPDDK